MNLRMFGDLLLQVRSSVGLITLILGFFVVPLGSRPVFAQPSRMTLNFAHAAMSPLVLPLWIAVDKGFFAKEGIDARLVFIRGSPVLLSSMASGEAQAGYTGGAAVLSAIARGLDLQIIASVGSRLSHDIVARPEIINPVDIKGKTFGVQALGGSVWMSAMLGLEHLGLDPARDKIKIIQIGDQTVLAQALEARAIDLTVLDKPLSNLMEKKGFRILTELAKVNIPFTSTGIVFRRSFIAKQPEIAERTLRGFLRGQGYLFDQRNKSEVVEIMVRRLGLNRSFADIGYTAAIAMFDRKPYPTIAGLRNIQRLLVRFNPDISKVAVEEAADMRFVERLDKSGFIDEVYRTGGQAP